MLMTDKRQLEPLADALAVMFAGERRQARADMSDVLDEFRDKMAAGLAELKAAMATLKDGAPGEAGERGEKGEQGEKGERGEKGDQGEKGEQGERGRIGEEGPQGPEGQRGEKGETGKAGERGPPGTFVAPEAWAEGIHYQGHLVFVDGSTWVARKDTAQRPPHADWAPVAMAGRDGISGEARGLYDPQETYRRLDRVSHNGSEWIARRDDPGPLPGDSDGWMLGAQGKKGKPGEKGERGERGEPGFGIIDVEVREYAFHVKLTNGKAIAFDLRPIFEHYDEEVRGG